MPTTACPLRAPQERELCAAATGPGQMTCIPIRRARLSIVRPLLGLLSGFRPGKARLRRILRLHDRAGTV